MRRTMRDTKALALARDHRHHPEEFEQSFPVPKRVLAKAARHEVQQQLHDATGPVDVELAEHAEELVLRTNPHAGHQGAGGADGHR